MKSQAYNPQRSRWIGKLTLSAAFALLTATLGTTARAQLTSTREGQPSQDLLSVSAIASNNHLFNVFCIDNIHENANGVPIVITCNNTFSWIGLDQTTRAGGPQVSAFSPLASIDDAFGYRVFYADSAQNLNQMLPAPTLVAPPTNTNLGVQSWGGISAYSANGEFTLASTVFERVFYETSDQHVHMLVSSNGGSFADEDLTRLTGGTLARRGSDFTSFHDGSGEHAFYFGANQHLYQLYGSWISYDICNPITRTCGPVSYIKWSNQDLTGTNGPLVGASLTSFSDATGEYVFYVGQDVHLHELSYGGAGWADQDLTIDAPAILPFSASGITGLTSLTNPLGRQVFFIGNDLNVHQIVLSSSGGIDTNLTTHANGPMVNPCFGLQLTSFSRTLDNLNQRESDVFYTTRDGTIHRLSQVGTEFWLFGGRPFWLVGGWTDVDIPFSVIDRCIE
jgi:hypothetical protein